MALDICGRPVAMDTRGRPRGGGVYDDVDDDDECRHAAVIVAGERLTTADSAHRWQVDTSVISMDAVRQADRCHRARVRLCTCARVCARACVGVRA